MRAIIIEEERFVEILERLKLEAEVLEKEETTTLSKQAVRNTHRNLHYHLVQWMQSHGARGIR